MKKWEKNDESLNDIISSLSKAEAKELLKKLKSDLEKEEEKGASFSVIKGLGIAIQCLESKLNKIEYEIKDECKGCIHKDGCGINEFFGKN